MVLTQRQEDILDKLVGDYISLARPVSSKLLEKRHKFGLSSATLRIEMQKLTDAGFLAQPHTSAGRVPTDKGYRLFVNNLLQKKAEKPKGASSISSRLSEKKISDEFGFADQITKFLAETSSNFGFFHFLDEHISWKEGWEEIFDEPEFADREFISDFAKFLDNFEERAEDLIENPGVKIYIGRESLIPLSGDFSIVLAKCFLPPGGREAILSILGPKRMDYKKNISLLDHLINELTH